MKKRVFLCILGLILASSVLWGVPLISYQGRLVDDGKLVDGTKQIRAKIYNALTSGQEMYNSGVKDIAVKDGVYTLDLPTSNFSTGGDLYLELEVSGVVLSPRTKINYLAYAAKVTTVNTQYFTTANLSATGSIAGQFLLSYGATTRWSGLFFLKSHDDNPFSNELINVSGVRTAPNPILPTTWKHLFASYTSVSSNMKLLPGDIGGVAGADAICNSDVNRLFNGETTTTRRYKAVIYRTDGGPYPFLGGTRLSDFTRPNQTGYYTLDDSLYLMDYSLKTLSSKSDISNNLYNKVGSPLNMWGSLNLNISGTFWYGDRNFNCNNWSSTSGATPYSANVYANGSVVTVPNYASCGSKYVLLCVEQ